MQLFQKSLMMSEDVKAMVGSGYLYLSTDKVACHDGAIVTVGGIETHSVYTGLKDINSRKLLAPANAIDLVSIVDYVGVSEGTINGVLYREGYKTAGLVAPAGSLVRYRNLAIGDTFWLATQNFADAPEIGKFAYPKAGYTTLTVASSALVNATVFKIEASKTLTEGAVNTSTQYFCTVVQLATAVQA